MGPTFLLSRQIVTGRPAARTRTVEASSASACRRYPAVKRVSDPETQRAAV
jgi:hypothetical protein